MAIRPSRLLIVAVILIWIVGLFTLFHDAMQRVGHNG